MKKLLIFFVFAFCLTACCQTASKCSLPENHEDVIRVGQVVKVKAEYLEEYKQIHADGHPGVRHLLKKYNMRNFSIYMEQLADGNWYEFAYYEYWGTDLEGDMAKLDAEPENQKWLEMCDPMQEGITPEQKGWKQMKRVYYNY